MLILLSPAKTFHDIADERFKDIDTFRFESKTKRLIESLCTYNEEWLGQWMKMSLDLAKINHARYQQLGKGKVKGYEAVDYFNGEVFKSLDIASIGEEAREYLNNHLIILSGLYGCVHPSDVIYPYRLEMGTKFGEPDIKELHKYWQEDLTTYILKCLAEKHNEKVLINLASKEYSKAVNLKMISKYYPVINIEFKEQTGENSYKVVGIYAKKARGKMVRYIAQNQVKTIEGLRAYNVDGYALNQELSTEHQLVFTR